MSMKKMYYNIGDDIALYPESWLYVAFSARGAGKTYGYFDYCIKNNLKFLYLKRTQVDIELLNKEEFSPFKPLNRDHDYNITTVKMYDGILKVMIEDKIIGLCMAMSAIHKYKGFDMSDIKIMCLDEFIPQLTERVNRREGELLLDLYMTVSRDREARGEDPLKLCLFANATELYCPITDTFDIVDSLAELNASGNEFKYLEDRKILLHKILYSVSADKESQIYKGMAGTQWAEMAFSGEFSYNDFSKVKKINMNGFVPYVHIIYHRKDFYIYQHKENGLFYLTDSKGRCNYNYDLEIESDQSAFWYDWVYNLQKEIIDGNMIFKTYSLYNLIRNYRKIYNVI